MIKTFSELENGTKFVYKGTEYEKVAQVKISCCKNINAQSTANAKIRTFIAPKAEVEVNS
jgi:hypothetical protein